MASMNAFYNSLLCISNAHILRSQFRSFMACHRFLLIWNDMANLSRVLALFFLLDFINKLCYSYWWSSYSNLSSFYWQLRSKLTFVELFLMAKFMNCLFYGIVKWVHILVANLRSLSYRAVGYLLNCADNWFLLEYLIISGSSIFKLSSFICAILSSSLFTTYRRRVPFWCFYKTLVNSIIFIVLHLF